MGYTFNIFTKKLDKTGINNIVAGSGITIDFTDPNNPVISSNGANITVVANYSALPAPATVSGKFYWVSSSQGTAWLPGSLGGTYYNSGLYYSNGATWEFLNVPYQATQSAVNTGTVTDQFVTPATLKNSSQWVTKQDALSGTGFVKIAGGVISYDNSTYLTTVAASSTYLTIASPAYTGYITTGTLGYADTGILGAVQSSINSYNQFIIQNSSNGTTASSDFVVNNNNSTATTFYGDFGMNGSGFTGTGSFNLPNAVYLSATSADLVLGTTTSNAIRFVVNNGATDALVIGTTGSATFANTVAATTLQILDAGGSYFNALVGDTTTGQLKIGNTGQFTRVNTPNQFYMFDSSSTYKQTLIANGSTLTFAGGWPTLNIPSTTITFNGALALGAGSTIQLININGAYSLSGSNNVIASNWTSALNQTAGTGMLIGYAAIPTITSITNAVAGFYSNITATPTGGGIGYAQYHAGTATSVFGGGIQLIDTTPKLALNVSSSGVLAFGNGFPNIITNSNLKLSTAGNGLYIKQGTNATCGRGTLVGGTLTINTNKATTTAEIFLTDRGGGVSANIGSLYISAISNGTSFTVSSTNALDTSIFSWLIIEAS